MAAPAAIVARNATRWIVEVAFEPGYMRVTFANGDRFRMPLDRLGDPARLRLLRTSIAPDGMSIAVPTKAGDPVEVPWDFVRAACDPAFAGEARKEEAATARAVGARVARLRHQVGITQGALSTRAGVARATVNRIERGRLVPEVETLRRLADALGVSLPSLLAGGTPRS